ncbi:RNA polymerase sigma-B factor OS=Streptomyces albaduncus OX=68172 GN=FHS32_000865 PE=4 SV=1 [Streptomyces griseoloalbus]
MTSTINRTDQAQSVTELPEVVNPGQVAPQDARELSRQFFRRLTELEEGTHEYQYARNTLIEMNTTLVRYAAGRFRSRGQEMEDIVQVGMIGLIKAIDRFELSREVEFTSFAIPYIVGEIKRFFRDTSWSCTRRAGSRRPGCSSPAPPRNCAAGGLTPTTAELATLMSLTEAEVNEARTGRQRLHNSASLDAAIGSEPDGVVLADFIGTEDAALGLVEDFHALAPMIAELDERERKIVHWRFVEELTQAEIGSGWGARRCMCCDCCRGLSSGCGPGCCAPTDGLSVTPSAETSVAGCGAFGCRTPLRCA